MKHRYPGPRSFTGDDSYLFFGRDTEKEELLRLIVLNDLVVLFGESGTGKTSLLQAGICPLLEERQYQTVFIRFNRTENTPDNQVFNTLKEGGYLPSDIQSDLSLGEYFSRFWYVNLGEIYTPVIVFDQFEEFFTLYTPEKRTVFIRQFAAYINRRIQETARTDNAAAPPVQAKFVFSLRSDFLYLLDELSADIPAILRCRYQLRQLNAESAKEAIIRPAKMAGEFRSPTFGFSKAALTGILKGLTLKASGADASGSESGEEPGKNADIAANQLQLVCAQIEERIIAASSAKDFEVTPEFYGGAEGLKQIIDDYYQKVIEKIVPEDRDAVETLLARGLLNNGRRIMVEAETLMNEYKVPKSALELLHDERLLKREIRKGETYYEISHDTLIYPILNRFKRIEEAEAAREAEQLRQNAKQEKQRADEAERLKNEAVAARNFADEEKKKAQKLSYYAIGLAGLALLASLAAGWYYLKSERDRDAAYEARDKAEASDRRARMAQVSDSLATIEAIEGRIEVERTLKKLKQEQRLKLLSDADAFRKDKRYDQALRAYDEALNLSDASTQISEIRQLQTVTRYEQNRAIGLALAAIKECEAAKPFLRAALQYKREDRQVLNALSECESKK